MVHSVYYNLPYSQLDRLQQIQNCLARAVVNVKAPEFTYTTPILKSLHWLKINQRIEYKILSLTYKVLTAAQPGYLRNLMLIHLVLKLVLLLLYLPSLDHHHLPLYKSLLCIAFGINFLPHCVNLILIILFLTLLNLIL